MKPNNRKNHKPGFKNHLAKTSAEREVYDQKIRCTDSEGGTKEEIPSKTATLSPRSIYSGSASAGTPDRNPIKPPPSSDGFLKWIGIFGGIFVILGTVATVCIWFTSLKNQVTFNEKCIDQLGVNIKTVDSKQESVNTRIAKLEQWKDIINDDLKQIKADTKN